MLYHLLHLFYDKINFFFGIMFTERKTYRYLVRIIIDGANNMRTLVGPAGAGATTTYANIIHIKGKQYHLRFLGLWERNTQHGVQAAAQRIAIEGDARHYILHLFHHI